MSAADPLAELSNYRRISPEIATSGQPTEAQFEAIAAQGRQSGRPMKSGKGLWRRC
jgi:hypothetical protein